jgi:hypothetical protein
MPYVLHHVAYSQADVSLSRLGMLGVEPAGVVHDGYRVISMSGQALSRQGELGRHLLVGAGVGDGPEFDIHNGGGCDAFLGWPARWACSASTSWTGRANVRRAPSGSRTGRHGTPSSTRRVCARSGWHDGRRTAATLQLSAGVQPRVVMEVLGHAQMRTTTDTYSHVMPALGRDAADRMGNALWEPPEP